MLSEDSLPHARRFILRHIEGRNKMPRAEAVKLWKRILLGIGLLALAAAAFAIWRFGPRNVIGMLRYDQRQEGSLKVGDRAPDVVLLAPDGKTPVHLSEFIGDRPLVLVFGSFT
jgi:hypothetical protein